MMFPNLITPAFAQSVGGVGTTEMMQYLPLLLVFGVFYFLLIRPQQQQAKKLKATLAGLKRGDQVVTSGGIVGRVVKATDGTPEVEVEIAPNVKVIVLRDTIASVVNPQAANDTKPASKAG
ncbi:preprotein translocase subunit YajC [Granulibacter bethesdensis]|uniref:preprotein translocase subunit YajC n=1 Tax=Granulibacter bethesdensis TaxID=364410 RepID=UPI000909D808|nr:preprotein translocase subunit YajC [Granulibacter bethesdensis]APH59576.1 Protein translocase subunit YajC [Granulibacter bethesdensis]